MMAHKLENRQRCTEAATELSHCGSTTLSFLCKYISSVFSEGQGCIFAGRVGEECTQTVHDLFSALRFHFVLTARASVQWWASVSADFIGYQSVWKLCDESLFICTSMSRQIWKEGGEKYKKSKESSCASLWDIFLQNIASVFTEE